MSELSTDTIAIFSMIFIAGAIDIKWIKIFFGILFLIISNLD